MNKWIDKVKDSYHLISTEFANDGPYSGEKGPAHWTTERFQHIIALRESALDFARQVWADYFLVSHTYFLENIKSKILGFFLLVVETDQFRSILASCYGIQNVLVFKHY